MASFGITTARGFLNKLIEDQLDFEASHCQAARHAINAVMTAYHLREWVWGDFAKHRPDLHTSWGLQGFPAKKEVDKFLSFLEQQCRALTDAQEVTNGTKHFGLSKIATGKSPGPFDPALFDPALFDVPCLWIDRSTGQRQNAEDFIRELADFWDGFFKQHSIP